MEEEQMKGKREEEVETRAAELKSEESGGVQSCHFILDCALSLSPLVLLGEMLIWHGVENSTEDQKQVRGKEKERSAPSCDLKCTLREMRKRTVELLKIFGTKDQDEQRFQLHLKYICQRVPYKGAICRIHSLFLKATLVLMLVFALVHM